MAGGDAADAPSVLFRLLERVDEKLYRLINDLGRAKEDPAELAEAPPLSRLPEGGSSGSAAHGRPARGNASTPVAVSNANDDQLFWRAFAGMASTEIAFRGNAATERARSRAAFRSYIYLSLIHI